MGYSADEACDVGRATGSPASTDYRPTDNAFTGTIEWAQIDIGDDSDDHLITAEDRMKIAMGKQQSARFARGAASSVRLWR